MELKPGTLLQGGKYEIRNSLGRGGFGVTYLAKHHMLNKMCCIKEYFPRGYYNRDVDSRGVVLGSQGSAELMNAYRNKFIKEAQTIAALDHPNIIKIHDVFEENNTAYYVMDYIEGDTLDAIVKRQGPMSVDVAKEYILKVAGALRYIHSANILHLDIKPANVLVRRSDNRVVLIDFGLAKQYDDDGNQTSSTPVGISERYAPMEQYEQGSKLTASTDIYALGATLFYLVTGQKPPLPSEVAEGKLLEVTAQLDERVRFAIVSSMQYLRRERPANIDAFVAFFDEDTIIPDLTRREEPIKPEKPVEPGNPKKPENRTDEVLPLYMKPNSGLALAILSTMFCCMPIGIVAIVKASKVSSLWSDRRYQEAKDAAKSARKWSITSIICGAIFLLLYLAVIIFVVIMEEESYSDSYYEDPYYDYSYPEETADQVDYYDDYAYPEAEAVEAW